MVPLTVARACTGCSTIFVIERKDRRRVTAVWRAVKVFLVAHVLIVETEILSWRKRHDLAHGVRRRRTWRKPAPLEYNVLGTVQGPAEFVSNQPNSLISCVLVAVLRCSVAWYDVANLTVLKNILGSIAPPVSVAAL